MLPRIIQERAGDQIFNMYPGEVHVLCSNNTGSAVTIPGPLNLSSDLENTLLLLFLLRGS